MTRRRYHEVRLGWGGDYICGADARGRIHFLVAVARLVPEALTALTAVDDDAALDAWCARWGFLATADARADWLRATARASVQELRLGRGWFQGVVNDADDVESAVHFSWNLIDESFEDFVARVKRVRAAAVRRWDLRRVPTIRLPEGTDECRPFEWLVLYQVAGWTYPRIAEHYDAGDADDLLEPKAVQMEVRRLARHLEIALRRGSPGRPRKKKPTPLFDTLP